MGSREAASDLGFCFTQRKSGEVVILRDGRAIATLRGRRASDFVSGVTAASLAEAQQRMARLTGNYKRGSERVAQKHPRNRA